MTNWSALTKRQQQSVIATVILTVGQVFILVYFGFFRSASVSGALGKEELRTLQGKLDVARIVALRAESVKTDMKKSLEKMEELAIYTPAASDRYAWAYEYVSRCAAQSHIELGNLEESLGRDKKENPTGSYELSITSRCDYNSLVEFIRQLEKDNPLLRIREVDINPIAGNNESHQISMILQWPSTVKIERGVQ